MAETYEERQTVMLEGMYKGVAGKIDELKQTVSKELQFNGEQSASTLDAFSENFRHGIESVLAELRYISQQNSAIYDYSKNERNALKDAMTAAVNERCEDIASAVTDFVDKMGKSLYEQLNAKIDEWGNTLMRAIKEVPAQVPSFITVEQLRPQPEPEKVQEPVKEEIKEVQVPVVFSDENIDYNVLAEKIASILPETDYDMLADKLAAAVPQPDENALLDKFVAAVPQADENAIADKVAEIIPLTDYDLIAEKVATVLEQEFEVTVGEEGLSRITSSVVEGLDYDRISEKVVELLKADGLDTEVISERVAELAKPEDIDYDQLAVKVAELTKPENLDYEELAARVAELTKPEDIDYEELAVRVAELTKPENLDYAELAARVAELTKPENLDYEELAVRVAELTKPENIDYEELAAKVAELAKPEDIDYEQLATKVAELAKPEEIDYEQLATKVAELAKPEEIDYDHLVTKVAEIAKPEEIDYDQLASKVAELTKVEEPEPVEPEPKEELAIAVAPKVVKEARPKPAPKPVAPPAPKPVAPPAPQEPELTTRLKRSFTAKLIESEEDVKDYYSELKNAFLSYKKTSSQMNWANDRFTHDRETVAKIAIRGKTLCLYLALNPEEFPTTVYHQKFAGDTKMYEKTPMLVKVKSTVTLKRALRLVELVMEVNGAVKVEREKVDYAKMYAFRREQDLLAEGLIKATVVPKSDMDF